MLKNQERQSILRQRWQHSHLPGRSGVEKIDEETEAVELPPHLTETAGTNEEKYERNARVVFIMFSGQK